MKLFELTVDEFRNILKSEINNNNSPDQKEWITITDVCHLLSISKPQVHKFINDGLLIKYKVGRRTYFKNSEVQQFINSGRIS